MAQYAFSLGFIAPDSGVIATRVELFVAEAGQMKKQRDGEWSIREFRFFISGVRENDPEF